MHVVHSTALTRRFGTDVAVNGVSLAVPAGQIFGLLGPAGAGKTTVIRLLAALLPPTSGSATVAGFDLRRDAAEVRRAVGYVSQTFSADGHRTGVEHLRGSHEHDCIPCRPRESRIREALEVMNLADFADRRVHQYSSGMIRRLGIAQALLHCPRVLVLDEPTAGLDPAARRAVWDHLRQIRDRFGTTIVLATRSVAEADALCEQLAILRGGAVAVVESAMALKAGLGLAHATLDDVFVRYAAVPLRPVWRAADVSRARQPAASG